jgi:hypothetical protein
MTQSTRPPSSLAESRGGPHYVAGRMGRFGRWLAAAIPYVAPGLLVAVAVQQIILSSTLHLPPWTGGGFGMFSSIDMTATRTVRGVLIVDGREVPIRLGAADPLGRQALQARALPTRVRLERLADLLARRSWLVDPALRVASPTDGSQATGVRPIRPSAVRLEIYRILFDPTTLQVERILLADATGIAP